MWQWEQDEKCNHCFVGIFYNDVFVKVMLLYSFISSRKYRFEILQIILSDVEDDQMELLQRLFTASVNEMLMTCKQTHTGPKWIETALSEVISSQPCYFFFFFLNKTDLKMVKRHRHSSYTLPYFLILHL